MSEWKKLLEPVTEDYLTGLTNKGIVKRACKDLEQAALSLKEEENCLTVNVEEVTCSLVFPLGESKCTCPSRSICKHIVMAVLYAKNQYAGYREEEKEEPLKENELGAAAEGCKETENIKQEVLKEADTYQGQDLSAEEQENKNGQYSEINQVEEIRAEEFRSVLDYPLVKLKRAIGEKRLQNLYFNTSQGLKPDIAVSSIITVFFPDTGITVRLLEPVEYSSCSCHKKELCQHKAEAILFYQLHTGKLTQQVLLPGTEEGKAVSMEGAKEMGELLKGFLGEQLAAGLARSSPAVMDSLERLAILSHNQKLPEFERRLRELNGEYQLYFKRTASFQINNLLNRLCSLYKRAEALAAAQTKEELAALAGEFRSGYFPCPPLSLTGMGQREFHSKSGYEGETYYFLSEDTQEWYTYTNVRPVFYENEKKRIPGDKSKAPWQLPCRLEELDGAKLLLYNGKASGEHRLSATSEAKAEYLGRRRLEKKKLKKQYFDDFLKLFEERLADSWQQEGELENSLVLVQPALIKNASFDSIKQEYSMELYDKEEHRIVLEVAYSKTEHYTIRYLERLAKRIGQGNMQAPCFFGSLYIKEGAMRLYPINYYENLE